MNAVVFAAAGITLLALFLFYAELETLRERHARPRAQFLNAARWGLVIALAWVLIPAADSAPGPERAATIIGLTVLVGAVILVPLGWFIRMGGREGDWELRRSKLEVSRLANRVKHDRDSVTPARIKEAAARVRYLRTPETAEVCDLMIAELEDLLAGEERWLEGGRRSIRLDYLSRALWLEEMPPPDNDPDEATFLWSLYKVFGRMMELGLADPSRDDLVEFRHLLDSLEEYRRPQTNGFIEAALRSATTWLADTAAGPWISSYEFEALGPSGLEEVQWLWGREAAMWGADLDGDDLRAIKQDLTRRSLGADVTVGAAAGSAAQPAEPNSTVPFEAGAQDPVTQVEPAAPDPTQGVSRPVKGAAKPTSGAARPTSGAARPVKGAAKPTSGAATSTRGRAPQVEKPAAGQE
jgi:hypothetical protein